MRLVLCGFVLGVAALQQQPALPGWISLSIGAAAFVLTVAYARFASGGSVSRVVACVMAAVLAGFGYAAWRAELRLREALPHEWEGRELVLTGHVRGLPINGERGVRFLFQVDTDTVRRERGIAHFPSVVQLTWSGWAGRVAPRFAPGERWQFAVRLKRPHGPANFGGRDVEAALFARGVRATGAVLGASARRLPGLAGGLTSTIDRWRFALGERIETALAAAPHRGIVMALAMGAGEAIEAADRAILRRTGTSHLVAISGLHIGFVAGLCAALAAWLWRRSCFIGRVLARNGAREWPLIVPTPLAAALAGTLCAAGYAALAGFNVPAQRALWMLVVVSAAFASGRSISPSLVLAWAAALVVLVDPWAVVSPGFWLSFGAVVAISFALHARLPARLPRTEIEDVHCDPFGHVDPFTSGDTAPPCAPRSWRAAVRRRVVRAREQLAAAMRAQYAVTIGLAPLTAFWFSQISLAGPVANALAIPWVSFLVTPIALIGVALPAPLDVAAYKLAHATLEPLMNVLQRLAAHSWAEWRLAKPSMWALACAYAGILWSLMPRGWPLRFAAPLAWLPLALPPPAAPASGAFRLTALDVGQGAAIVIETARHALLFDAGPGPESTRAGERIVAPYLHANGVPTLDTLVVSHPDADHAGGAAAVLEAVRVRQVLGGLPPGHLLWAVGEAMGAQTLRCAAGQRWQWDGVTFAVLWPRPGPLPRKSNARSCVLKVEADGFAALLTGDIDAAVERTLVRSETSAAHAGSAGNIHGTAVSGEAGGNDALAGIVGTGGTVGRTAGAAGAEASTGLAADVLIVAHHGSKTSSTESFLDSVRPRVAVFQVGYRNRFGHPHPDVWSRFAARGIELARTDRDGAARIELDGGILTLERYRDTHRRYWMNGEGASETAVH